MVTDTERQAIVDEEHLRLLPIFYWILAGLDVLFSLYGLIYVAYGAFFAFMPWDEMQTRSDVPADAFPAIIGWLFAGIGGAIVLWFLGSAALKILAGIWIRQRRRRTACLVIAGITCLQMPFGTAVGVITFIVMSRPSVAALFAVPHQTADAPHAEAPAVEVTAVEQAPASDEGAS